MKSIAIKFTKFLAKENIFGGWLSCKNYKTLFLKELIKLDGGGGGIRTHGRVAPSSVFKTGAFNHSATPPTSVQLSKNF